MEALSPENKAKFVEQLQRPSATSTPKPGRNFDFGIPSATKIAAKKAPILSNHPWQRPAAGFSANPPAPARAPKSSVTGDKEALKPSPSSMKAPPAGSPRALKSSTALAAPACVNYSQVGVWEMTSEYNLVQCKAIHKEKGYDCTLDSGSCLNLIQWKTVQDFGLASSLLDISIPFKVADGHVAQTMGELRDVRLSFGDCTFTITFSVVNSMDHTILLGTSFMHQAGCVLSFHKKEPQIELSDALGNHSKIPVTYHRSHKWIREMESDRRNWPTEKPSREEGASLARVSAMLPDFSTIPAKRDASIICSTTAAMTTSSVKLETKQQALGMGPGSLSSPAKHGSASAVNLKGSYSKASVVQPLPQATSSADTSASVPYKSRNLESYAPPDGMALASTHALSSPSWPSALDDDGDWSLVKLPPPAEVHPLLWDAYIEEMSITSRGIKYYPGIPFQASFAQDILVAAYPFLRFIHFSGMPISRR